MRANSWCTLLLGTVALVSLTITSGCHSASHPDKQQAVYAALVQNDLRPVVVSQDQNAGVITLTGIVGSQAQKDKAQSVAQGAAPGYKITNQITVDKTGLMQMANPNAKAPQVTTAPAPARQRK